MIGPNMMRFEFDIYIEKLCNTFSKHQSIETQKPPTFLSIELKISIIATTIYRKIPQEILQNRIDKHGLKYNIKQLLICILTICELFVNSLKCNLVLLF